MNLEYCPTVTHFAIQIFILISNKENIDILLIFVFMGILLDLKVKLITVVPRNRLMKKMCINMRTETSFLLVILVLIDTYKYMCVLYLKLNS